MQDLYHLLTNFGLNLMSAARGNIFATAATTARSSMFQAARAQEMADRKAIDQAI